LGHDEDDGHAVEGKTKVSSSAPKNKETTNSRFVDEGEGTVLELSCQNTLRVEIRKLLRVDGGWSAHCPRLSFYPKSRSPSPHLDLERRLEASSMLVATSHDEQRPLLAQRSLRQRLELLVVLQDIPNLTRKVVQAIDDGVPPRGERDAILRELNGHHDESDVLRGVGLGGSDSNFGTGVDMDSAVRFARNGRTDDVDDSDVEGAALEAVTHGEDRVGRLARLGDEDADVVAEDGGLAVEEVGGELDGDGDLGQLLEDGASL
jgi:hypothetical protein